MTLCNFNLNLHNGASIFHQMLDLVVDPTEQGHILSIINTLSLRYLFKKCHKDRAIKGKVDGRCLYPEPKQSSIFMAYFYYYCYKFEQFELHSVFDQVMTEEGINEMLDEGEIQALCSGFA